MEHGVTQCAKRKVGGMDPLSLAYCRPQFPGLVPKPPLPLVFDSFVFASNQELEAGKPGNDATALHVAN